MPNRLAQESSPYLLQHAQNPVDWYPWGPEALARARAEQKPIFLSIGYSACHWCHVMEHESFENDEIAALLNQNFVCIKVDREERPDLDQIYMQAVQLISGRGGWPMSVFLTPELEPFFGGTYWPPTSRMGMPGFDRVLAAVLDAWNQRRDQVAEQSRALVERIRQLGNLGGPAAPLDRRVLEAAAASLERVFDHRHGGFGGAPKFPHPMDLRLLLRQARREGREAMREMVTLTLDKMAAGGIYDQLGGGFHRYSVDERWLVPHFEKMLYDNALLLSCYVEAYQATGNVDYARVARETADYVLREMTDPQGGFYSTLDADSEAEEGKFYVWTPAELVEHLGEEPARRFAYVYDVTEAGNFEGHNILNRPKTLAQCAPILNVDQAELAAELAQSRTKLLEVRSRRVWPALDDKVLVCWNALMIDSLALAGAALGEPRYVNAAAGAADFILRAMSAPEGRLYHCWRQGQAKLSAYLDDYAALIGALITLYETTGEDRWIERATQLTDVTLAHFSDPDGGAFFYTADDHESLIDRPKDAIDSSVPSGNGLLATALLRLGKLSGRAGDTDAATRILQSYARLIEQSPTSAGQMLLALDFHLGPTPELVLVGPAAQVAGAVADFYRHFLPNRVLAWRSDDLAEARGPLAITFQEKRPEGGELTLYVCQNFACQAPVTGPTAVGATWARLAEATSP